MKIRPIDDQDRVLGNPQAPVIFIEYVDLECSYCQSFHKTMERIIDKYGKEGKVAWVYRHFPRSSQAKTNPGMNSKNAAIVSECVAKHVGNNEFWKYISTVFETSPSSLESENIKTIALDLGLTEENYELCIKDDQIKSKVNQDILDGLNIYKEDPNFGTPYTIIVSNSGFSTVINGAQPYLLISSILDQIFLIDDSK